MIVNMQTPYVFESYFAPVPLPQGDRPLLSHASGDRPAIKSI